ncbi:MAG TPA: bifunctional phosphoglucose/phosphomannose isomerase [candidate division Zixibacteria bacterium]
MLDDSNALRKSDPSGMYNLIYNFPSQFKNASTLGKSLLLPDWRARDIKNIVLVGMGGSAIGGDLVRSYLAGELKVPFLINRSYTLPNLVGPASLVFLSSYSGNTEETLSAYDQAKERKAKIVCISSGGKLLEQAVQDGFFSIKIPEGYPPRAALGYSFVLPLMVLAFLKLVPDKEKEMEETIKSLTNGVNVYKMERKTSENPAKNLALRLHKKLPIIYAAENHLDAVATRWKGQVCENAKMLAFSNLFPEFNHNELVGWKVIDGYKDKLVVIVLKDRDDHIRIKRRMEIVKGIIEKMGVEVIEKESAGEGLLSRIFSLIQLGDFTSFYLAILNQIDPFPVDIINFLKDELAKE